MKDKARERERKDAEAEVRLQDWLNHEDSCCERGGYRRVFPVVEQGDKGAASTSASASSRYVQPVAGHCVTRFEGSFRPVSLYVPHNLLLACHCRYHAFAGAHYTTTVRSINYKRAAKKRVGVIYLDFANPSTVTEGPHVSP